jgi:hypothetical protein
MGTVLMAFDETLMLIKVLEQGYIKGIYHRHDFYLKTVKSTFAKWFRGMFNQTSSWYIN